MQSLNLCLFSAITALAASLTPAASQTPAPPGAIPFPPGYDFPADPRDLARMVADRDVSGVRRHAWFLWAGLNQNGHNGWPIWRSWPIATQVFATDQVFDVVAPIPGSGATAAPMSPQIGRSMKVISQEHNPAINLTIPGYMIPKVVREKYPKLLQGIHVSANIPDGQNFQNNGDLMLVSEAYSADAYQSIRDLKLYASSTLDSLLNDRAPDIPAVEPRSIVLKHMYWPVKRAGLSALPVYDMQGYEKPAQDPNTYIGFENRVRWKRAVAIDTTGRPIPPGKTASVTYLHDVRKYEPRSSTQKMPPLLGPVTYPHAKVVPISDFYFKQIFEADYQQLSDWDRVLLDASFYWAHGRLFEFGDYVVAVASHVITKEMPSWTLQTAWWHPEPSNNPYAADRPELLGAKGPWQHYLMAVDYGIPATPGGPLPIAYNPYIELASHPVVTNCRNCHVRAAWPHGQYIQNPGPDALADISVSNPIFKNLLRTDFLWTVTGRAMPRPPFQ